MGEVDMLWAGVGVGQLGGGCAAAGLGCRCWGKKADRLGSPKPVSQMSIGR